jgi:hypothetical protein
MNFPVNFGLPQVIFLLLFILGIGLIISSLMSLRPGRVETILDEEGRHHRRRRRRRFRWRHGTGGITLLIIGIIVVWLASLTQAYIGTTHEVRAAQVRAVPITNSAGGIPQMSVTITLYDQDQKPTTTSTYLMKGDRWMVQAVVVEVQPWLGIIGMHSGYKLTRLQGIYSDPDMERKQEHTVVVLNGGEDDFFKTVKADGWYTQFVRGNYGSATFLPADGKLYDVLATQTGGIKALPANGP